MPAGVGADAPAGDPETDDWPRLVAEVSAIIADCAVVNRSFSSWASWA
jgi:hypothetical protein